jgi:DNA repair protein RecN (Recombination protein N)
MLNTLVINDIVLIEKLDLALTSGLIVMTGETGAGKSIVLDALGLVLGNRADSGLVRHGREQGSVTAIFDLDDQHPAFQILQEQGVITGSDSLILRRLIGVDGKSRAFVNDNPVSVGLLRRLGDVLVEVHGQHDDRGLLNPAGHRALLDSFAQVADNKKAVSSTYQKWMEATAKLEAEKIALESLRAEQEYDQHSYDELLEINPQENEEDELDSQRRLMMQGEKVMGDLKSIVQDLEAKGGVDSSIRGAVSRLIKLNEGLEGHLDEAIEALSRGAEETTIGLDELRVAHRDMNFDGETLDYTEERLFALRALARKHRTDVASLPKLKAEIENKLNQLSRGEDEMVRLKDEQAEAYEIFVHAVGKLSRKRRKAAVKLSAAVMAELPTLKLENAIFEVSVIPLEAENWSAEGAERVEFLIATNKGTELAPMMKVASGGELARVILALKVELAKTGCAPTLIFDEVDRGIGGATADAVGERLKSLSEQSQVLVVTHSPQVAARGSSHLRITKFEASNHGKTQTYTKLAHLSEEERREEIARMLSGASVTDEARAAAERLMKAS